MREDLAKWASAILRQIVKRGLTITYVPWRDVKGVPDATFCVDGRGSAYVA